MYIKPEAKKKKKKKKKRDLYSCGDNQTRFSLALFRALVYFFASTFAPPVVVVVVVMIINIASSCSPLLYQQFVPRLELVTLPWALVGFLLSRLC